MNQEKENSASSQPAGKETPLKRLLREGAFKFVIGLLLLIPFGFMVWRANYVPTIPKRIGNFSGVHMAIPENYIYFPVEYEGETIWAPLKNPPKRTYESPISSFAVYVQWPNFEPRSQSNEESYRASRGGKLSDGLNEWVMIGVQSFKQPGKPLSQDFVKNASKGYIVLLEGWISQLIDRPNEKMSAPPPDDSHYIITPADPALGLNKIHIRDQEKAQDKPLSTDIYWSGIRKERVPTVIQCYQRIDKADPGRCKHEFVLTELAVGLSVTYDMKWLPHWREIEDKSKKLILSFRVQDQRGAK